MYCILPKDYYITPQWLNVFSAGCNPAKKHEVVPFSACIRQMADTCRKDFEVRKRLVSLFRVLSKRFCGRKALSKLFKLILSSFN